MAGMLRIEPVRPADRPRALALLAGGRVPMAAHPRLARLSGALSGPDAARYRLWWARSLRGPRAAAMTVRNPGRTAIIVSGPAGRPTDLLIRLLAAVTDATLADEVAFVQAMFTPADDADVQAYIRAGYRYLAELIYLRRRLEPPPQAPAAPLEWPSLAAGDEQRLGRILGETYVDSLDCPGLRGLRPIEDVIAGHKACGVFRPASWWMPTHEGQPVGCVLVNDDARDTGAAEIVYLGVRPAYRGRGFGRAMLRHALTDARRRGLKLMNVAADAANAPAAGMYRGEGFREVDRREVYIRAGGRPAGRQGRGSARGAAGAVDFL